MLILNYNLHIFFFCFFLKDNCIYDKNRDQADQDNDKLGDVCDNCHDIYNPKQENMDNDAKGDVCDEDVENDGFGNYSFYSITV